MLRPVRVWLMKRSRMIRQTIDVTTSKNMMSVTREPRKSSKIADCRSMKSGKGRLPGPSRKSCWIHVGHEERRADGGDQVREPRGVPSSKRPVGKSLEQLPPLPRTQDRRRRSAAVTTRTSAGPVTGSVMPSHCRRCKRSRHHRSEDHVVSEVDELQHAVDHRVAQCDQGVQEAQDEARYDLRADKSGIAVQSIPPGELSSCR